MMTLTRRSFLHSALALSLLPDFASAAEADVATLAAASETLKEEPMRFLVDGNGEVRLAGYDDAVNRYDAYNVTPAEIRDSTQFYSVLERIRALRDEVFGFSWDDDLEDYAMGEDYDEGTVSEYVDGLSEAEYDGLIGVIEDWFADPISPEERYSSDIMRPIDGVAMAYELFSRGDLWNAVTPLGLVEIDGECPGYDYRGIRLEGTLEAANAAAKALDLPIHFEGDTA
jgi:hypothetical protein